MASSSGSDSNKQVEVCLTEDDIPGAVLQPPFERHTVSELRFWLLCRGVTVAASMKKSQIIEKYVTCRNAHKLLLGEARTLFGESNEGPLTCEKHFKPL